MQANFAAMQANLAAIQAANLASMQAFASQMAMFYPVINRYNGATQTLSWDLARAGNRGRGGALKRMLREHAGTLRHLRLR